MKTLILVLLLLVPNKVLGGMVIVPDPQEAHYLIDRECTSMMTAQDGKSAQGFWVCFGIQADAYLQMYIRYKMAYVNLSDAEDVPKKTLEQNERYLDAIADSVNLSNIRTKCFNMVDPIVKTIFLRN